MTRQELDHVKTLRGVLSIRLDDLVRNLGLVKFTNNALDTCDDVLKKNGERPPND